MAELADFDPGNGHLHTCPNTRAMGSMDVRLCDCAAQLYGITQGMAEAAAVARHLGIGLPDNRGVRRLELATLDAFRERGLLWYINRTAFHPRGMALALGGDESYAELWGNRDTPWSMPEEVDDAMLPIVEATFDEVRET